MARKRKGSKKTRPQGGPKGRARDAGVSSSRPRQVSQTTKRARRTRTLVPQVAITAPSRASRKERQPPLKRKERESLHPAAQLWLRDQLDYDRQRARYGLPEGRVIYREDYDCRTRKANRRHHVIASTGGGKIGYKRTKRRTC